MAGVTKKYNHAYVKSFYKNFGGKKKTEMTRINYCGFPENNKVIF